MAKTQEELNQLKKEYETLTNKLKELSGDELGYVTGGNFGMVTYQCDIDCNLNPDTCSAKKTTGRCPKEGI
ncbi:MAG: hypothetical protein KBT35_08270 [Firmicutes bacterium]|nr:hypothetical protein [Candidatus Colivicinus equi]